MQDCRLIAIPPADDLSVAELVSACRAAERGGATAVQLRMKNTSAGQMWAAAVELRRSLAVPLYLNDRVDVARISGASGVHVGADDMPPSRIRAVAPRPMRVGVSVGSTDEAMRALDADADYWSIGPFAATGSKVDAGPALGAAGFRELARLAPAGMAVIAIGGITAGHIPAVVAAGGVGVAAISAIFGADDVTVATRRLRDAIDECLRSGS